MKLFFDARYIRTDLHDGISRYSTELGNALARLTPVTFIICDPAQRAVLPKNTNTILIHAPTSAREPLTARTLNRYHPDVVVSPMQTIGSLGRHFKLIVTLHDMIYYRHRTPPRALNQAVRLGWRAYHMTYIPQRITLNRADMVATVSQTSKSDFESVNLTKRPIVVIPNAPQNLRQFLDRDVAYKKPPNNLVYMGSFMRYKNVEALIAGMEYLPGRTLHLLSRISTKRRAELQKCIPKEANVVFHGGVSDEEYAQILGDNAALVSASRDEGYGLPLAEALALGVPAVVSDLAIHHEVAGEGALYFGANKPREFADRVLQLDDKKIANQLVKQGQRHIAQYRWDTSAEILLETAIKLHKSE
ncbi:MAG: glycosyltransferase family 1 protein [Candidatus Saccharimonadales bacterium]